MRNVVGLHVGGHASLGSLLDEALIRHGGSDALIEANRRREASRWTYRDVDRAAGRVARRLIDAGVAPGDRVAILMSNQPRWLITATAVFRCGAVLVPLDFKLQPDEQVALLGHAAPRVVVIEYGLFRALPPVCGPTVWVSEAPDDADLGGAQRWEDLPEAEAPSIPRGSDDVATIVYSSGTAGRAKGCMLTHGAYLAQLEGLLAHFPMAAGDRYFSVLPTNHAIDFMVGFVGPFVCGAQVVHQRALRPELIRWTLQRYGITHMAVVPLLLTAFRRAMDEARDAQPAWRRDALDLIVGINARLTRHRPRHAISSRILKPVHDRFGGQLKLLFCGGAFTDRTLAEDFYRLGLPVVIGYGLTEACTVVTVNGVTPFRADSVGRPLPGITVRIDRPDASGIGEVCVSGPTLMQGYVDDPTLTAETIREGWLHTGDLGWIDASDHLHLVGRIKDVIVTAGGKNVYPEDIEHAFTEIGAEEIAVFAAHSLWPARDLEGEELVAVVRGDPETVDPIRRANRRLADHKRISSVVWWDEPFPRTASLKLKRRDLARQVGDTVSRDARVDLSG